MKAAGEESLQIELDGWYDNTLLPGVVNLEGVERATRYSLYWVLMTRKTVLVTDPLVVIDLPGLVRLMTVDADRNLVRS